MFLAVMVMVVAVIVEPLVCCVLTDYLLFGELKYLLTGTRSLFFLGHHRPVDEVVGRRDGRRPLGGRLTPPRPRPRQGAVEPDPLHAGRQIPGDLLTVTVNLLSKRNRRAQMETEKQEIRNYKLNEHQLTKGRL